MQIKISFLARIILSITLIGVVCLPGCTPAPCTVDYLIFMINQANSTPATTNTIDLPAGCIYTLTEIDNQTEGNNGLPVITSPVIINGNDATIQRDPNSQQKFRLFLVSNQGDLSINHLTLTGGYSYNEVNLNTLAANSGGAIFNWGHLYIVKSTLRGNSGVEGGGIFNANDMILKDVTIDSNQDYLGAMAGGAGINNWGTAVIANSTISNNGFNSSTPADGIFNSGPLEMTNSTISHNAGCGIDNEGELVLNHVTMAFNYCGIASHGDVYTSNSIFGEGCGFGNIQSVFPNLSTDDSCGGPVVSFAALELQPLADNGGVTKTHALGAGSVAIDMVVRDCLPTDQRGVSRPQGAKCDVGAYEYIPPPAPALGTTDTPTPTSTSTTTPTTTPERKACIFTARVNLFCRAGPGASFYRNVDEFTAGQSAEVVAQSPDGLFVYVRGPNTGTQCVVSPVAKFGTLEGDCEQLLVFTPPPILAVPTRTEKAKDKSPDSNSPSGCTVRQASGALSCEVPCPPKAVPGDPCTP